MAFKVGVTTGLYTIARAEELSTALRKIGYGLTRGTSAIEISGDVPHEVTETDGKEIRYLAGKQGIDLLFHGSLTVPMCMPERADWRDAHDHMQKSARSAVNCGCKYVLFHACLNIWLELMTYAGRKLTMAFVDHEGNFISKILAESKSLREWFILKRWDDYVTDILTPDERVEAGTKAETEVSSWRRNQIAERMRNLNIDERLINQLITTEIVPKELEPLKTEIDKIVEDVRAEASKKHAKLLENYYKDAIRKKFVGGRKWYREELRAVVGIIDGYHIMANYMFFENDPIWAEMSRMYSSVLAEYKLDRSNIDSLDKAWEEAERKNDRLFKEFFYGLVGAKYLEGHLKKLLEWLEGDYIKKELKDKPELQKIANNLLITIESPDARDPTHAGLHLLWSPRQMYAAIKTIRRTLKTNRIWMTPDFEHIATQGLDPIKELEEVIRIAPDFGSYVVSVHSNAPNPLHAHEPLELGDVRIYQLLWFLRKSGMGKEGRKVYILFERGGAKDPFVHSVDVLKFAVKFLEQEIPPDELPLEYFGMEGPTAGGYKRQEQIIRDHAWEPLKDLLEIPEEEWTMLSQAAIKKGKKPEVWKKAEFR